MNRRDFTLRLAALFGTPALPVGSIAKAASTIPTGAYEHFKLAKLVARAHNNCSKTFLMRHLKVDAEMAAHVESILVERNVITLPNLKGISRAVNPMNTHTIHTEALKVRAPLDKPDLVEKAKEYLKKENQVKEQDEPEELAALESTDPEGEQDKTEQSVPSGHTDPE